MLDVDIKSFSYSDKEVLRNISFSLKKGEHLAVLGESGCGKSTLLHVIYGLLHLDEGSISYKEKKLLGPNFNLVPGEDFMKLVAQDLNVMPFKSVAENIAEYLSRRNTEDDEKRVNQLLQVVELEGFKNTMVKNLSGGQKQRVAIAKALANEPEILLLDEPFSSIDTFRKNKLRRKLFTYLKEKKISCITATHDADEALAFSDRVLMLKDGTVEKMGAPQEIYKNLKTEYQAGFFGEVSVIPAGIFSKKKLILLPHQLEVSESKTNLEVRVIQCYFKGTHFLIEADFEGIPVFFDSKNDLKLQRSAFLTLSE